VLAFRVIDAESAAPLARGRIDSIVAPGRPERRVAPRSWAIVRAATSLGGAMAVTCPVDLDTLRLRKEVQSIYARVASAPDGEFHFHRGREYAERFLRYDAQALERIPPFTVESFAGGAGADAVISNGVLNLAPDKRRAFSEVLRVLRPGGRFLYADIVVAAELPESIRRDIDLWSG
jgi:SAM-dependent methyltransferase